ncbi:hypothetical protein [Chitinimonas koreensis]|uniref:hypothetical protein n=1 Tax=Chitinimonas koreensis TaxID=356302 RepID=UPI0022400A73|nr:hypothetical protein [Chitinimonas koreensis]
MTAFVFNEPNFDAHEQVVFVSEPKSGLKAILAVHNTNLGPPWAAAACGTTPAKAKRSPTCCACRAA